MASELWISRDKEKDLHEVWPRRPKFDTYGVYWNDGPGHYSHYIATMVGRRAAKLFGFPPLRPGTCGKLKRVGDHWEIDGEIKKGGG